MGKNKRGKLGGASNKKQKPCLKPKALAAIKTRVSQSGAITKPGSKAAPTKQHKQLLHSEPTIPFAKNDRILLIGDGDLSFARSLVEHHGIKKLTATVLEKDVTELEGKYSHVVDNLAVLEGNDEGVKLVYNVDATKMGVWDAQGNVGKKKGRRGGIDRILFNFPHVGGKSKDVNRQVRYNQGKLNRWDHGEGRMLTSCRTSSQLLQSCDTISSITRIDNSDPVRGHAIYTLEYTRSCTTLRLGR